jgi:hypothetical protein
LFETDDLVLVQVASQAKPTQNGGNAALNVWIFLIYICGVEGATNNYSTLNPWMELVVRMLRKWIDGVKMS